MVKRSWPQPCVRNRVVQLVMLRWSSCQPDFGQSGVEQGLALLQMICETLRLPFRRDVVDRMLKGMVGNKSSPSLENIGQIADGLGLNAVLMQSCRRLISADFPCLQFSNSRKRKGLFSSLDQPMGV